MPQGVIFDMDGVLVASAEPHRQSWRVLAKKHGINMPDEEFNKTFGMTSRAIINKLWGDELSDNEIRRIDDEKEAVYRELISGMVPLSIGVRETLGALRDAGYVLALGTSGPRENVELVLGETGIGSYFAATVTGFDVERGKPQPDIFLKAAERAGLRPGDCVVIEDAPVGIEAALNAKMKVVGYAGTHPASTLEAAGAHLVVNELAEITPECVTALLS